MDWIRSKSVIKDQKLKSKSKFDCVVTECDIYPVHVLCSQLQFAVCEFIHALIILVVLERGRDFLNQAIKVMRVSGFVFWMAVKTKYEIFATTHRFNLDLGRNRSVVNGDSDKSWFTDNTGLPNC